MGLRIFEPCEDPTGATCQIIEDLDNLKLAETHWYPSSARIFDGSLVGTYSWTSSTVNRLIYLLR